VNPVTHILLSHDLSTLLPLDRRERAAVLVVGTIPDLDAAGWPVRFFTAGEGLAGWFLSWHHVLCHNLAFGVLVSVGAAFAAARGARRRLLAFSASLLAFHFHLLCDVLGSRGPDGHTWPIAWLWPFAPDFGISWSGQWALNAWPNLVITALALVYLFRVAVRRGITPAEGLSLRWNEEIVRTLRHRFGRGEAD
jgi:hypothetical protein